jgi:hypothetical protein
MEAETDEPDHMGSGLGKHPRIPAIPASTSPPVQAEAEQHPLWAPDLTCLNDDAHGWPEGECIAVVIAVKPSRTPGRVALGLRVLDADGTPTQFYVGMTEQEGHLEKGDKLEVTLLRDGRGMFVHSQYFTEKFHQMMMAI